MRPEDRADQRQMDSVRAEMHAAIDRIVDRWPAAQRMATEMGRGYPSRGDGGSSGGGGSPTERIALADDLDPGRRATEVLAQLAELRGHVKLVDRASAALMPAPAPEPGRTNQVELCAECGEPAPKVKRLDGAPIHHPDDTGCWWAAYNRTRGRRGA